MLNAVRPDLRHDLRHVHRREDDDRDRLVRPLAAQAVEKHEPVHSRQHDVQEDQARWRLDGEQRFPPVRGDAGAIALPRASSRASIVHVILDGEDGRRRGRN